MTNPTITHNQGYFDDCHDTTGWTETEDGNTCALTVDNDDFFNLDVTVSAGNKIAYYSYPDEGGASNIAISTNTYPYAICRYKTSDDNIKAKIEFVFSDATTQTVLDETSSTNYATVAVVPTTAKTLDHVRLYANQATGHVYYDFVLMCQTNFTFPFVAPGGIWYRGHNRYPDIPIPSRIGNIPQYGGADSPFIEMTGTMDTNTDWGTPNLGDKLYQIHRQSCTNPWQWFTSDLVNCKVVMVDWEVGQLAETPVQRVWRILLKQVSRSGGQGGHHDYLDWFGW